MSKLADESSARPASATAGMTPDEARHYEHLLREAETIQGVSLGKDAWRRLRKNPMAMFSLWFLAILGLSALLVPLLPLQSPRDTVTAENFARPVLWPLFVPALEIASAEEQGQAPALDDSALDDSALDDTARDENAADAGAADSDAVSGEEAGSAPVRTKTQAELDRDAFGDLNVFDRTLLKVRRAIFGAWCVNSVCGRDKLGRDVLSRLFWGARVSLMVGIVATLVSLFIGVTYGAISGYVGGRLDNLMMRTVDVLYSVPFIYVVIFLIGVLSEDSIKQRLDEIGFNRITIFYAVVGAIFWLTMARVIRGQIMSLKNEQFVDAARTIGAGRGRIIFRHLVPNVISVIIVYLTLTIPRVMLFEAFLSFLGLGVEPPDVSWGLMANQGAEVITPIGIYWWLVVFPGLALGMTLFALNFLGDGLRDAFDPRLKNR